VPTDIMFSTCNSYSEKVKQPSLQNMALEEGTEGKAGVWLYP